MIINPLQVSQNGSRNHLMQWGLLCVLFLLIWPVSPLSILTFILLVCLMRFMVLALGSRRSCGRLVFSAFLFYSVCAVLLFHAQRNSLPEWGGLTGPTGIGTDDTFYYTQATGRYDANWPEVVKAGAFELHPYSAFLQKIVWFIAIYKAPHLLDLLLVNAFALSFLPFLCAQGMQKCFPGWRTAPDGRRMVQLAYWLPMFHPSLWSDGLVLIRDGWTAVLFMGALVALLHASYARYLFSVIVLAYFRLASSITLILCSAPLLWPVGRRKFGRHTLLIVGGISAFCLALLVFAWVSGYVEQKEISFLRDEYVQTFLAKAADQKESLSTLYLIENLPTYLRIPSSFLFFLCAPFAAIDLTRHDVFIPRLLLGSAAGILNIILLKWWLQSLVASWQEWHRRRSVIWFDLHIAYMSGIFLISTMSLQIRHKTMLLPLLCMLAAHGALQRDLRARNIGLAGMLFLGAVNVANLLMRL